MRYCVSPAICNSKAKLKYVTANSHKQPPDRNIEGSHGQRKHCGTRVCKASVRHGIEEALVKDAIGPTPPDALLFQCVLHPSIPVNPTVMVYRRARKHLVS